MKNKFVTLNGCFDVLHSGHIDLLKFAKEQGDHLTVLINSDESVKRFKGPNRPINNQFDRAKVLMAIKYVDDVIIFKEDDPTWWLELLQPSIHVKSKDAIPERVAKEKEIVELFGGQIVYFTPVTDISSTKLIEKMQKE